MALNSSTVAPSPASSTSSSAAGTGNSPAVNASRLRENQRRSRARKKEYLLSLEARFQTCQRIGIEANIEIQNAAKKVVRENQILRSMLKRRGVTDSEIDKTLREGGEGGVDGETAVEGVLKVLGRRPCGGGEPIGGTGTQCQPTRASERMVTERRNSTGMVAAREADRGGGKGAGPLALAVATTPKLPSQSLSPQQYTSSNYPTPTPTPTTAPASNYTPTPSLAQMNGFYNYGMSSPPSQPSYSSTIINPSPTYTSYQMSPSVCASSNSCCSQAQAPFCPTTQSQCSPSSSAVSSSCCSPQRPMYPTTMPSSARCSYQTASISSSTPCSLAQTFIHQLHPGLPEDSASHLIDEICPPGMMEASQCHVDNAVLFGLLDRI